MFSPLRCPHSLFLLKPALTIQWEQTEEGYYTLQLINSSGQAVYQKEIWIDAGARLLNLEIPRVAAGNYFLVLVNKESGRKYAEKIIIQ
ncbi:MAG: T9SS type A sorting domain-containing protein [Bacteroidetes bacterium]|nr:T9SS type A sorting domain-containing protein [Bacteroidota bacterium]